MQNQLTSWCWRGPCVCALNLTFLFRFECESITCEAREETGWTAGWCFIHESPLLRGLFFSIQIPAVVQSVLHSVFWLPVIDHKQGTLSARGFMVWDSLIAQKSIRRDVGNAPEFSCPSLIRGDASTVFVKQEAVHHVADMRRQYVTCRLLINAAAVQSLEASSLSRNKFSCARPSAKKRRRHDITS